MTIDAEDSLALQTEARGPAPPGASIAIVRFPCLSNATDFRLLTWADWIASPSSRHYDFVILPGSKNTIEDLRWLRQVGLADWIVGEHRRGATVIGICGGFQMLGRVIGDPAGMESPHQSADGLGLLPAETILAADKTTRVRTATTAGGVTFGAYEIHLGVTTVERPAVPFATLDNGDVDGACVERVVGTYLHGALESAGCLHGAVSRPDAERRLEARTVPSGSPTGSAGTAAAWSGWDCSESRNHGSLHAAEASQSLPRDETLRAVADP